MEVTMKNKLLVDQSENGAVTILFYSAKWFMLITQRIKRYMEFQKTFLMTRLNPLRLLSLSLKIQLVFAASQLMELNMLPYPKLNL